MPYKPNPEARGVSHKTDREGGGAIVNSDDFDDRLVSGNCSEMRTSVPPLLAVALFDGSAFELRLFSYVAIVLHLHT